MAERKARSSVKNPGQAGPRSKPSTAVKAGPESAIADDSRILFQATLHRPVSDTVVDWTFLNLPQEASERLPSRGMTSVEGTFNGVAFQATLEPDGQGGHWLKVQQELQESAGAAVGDPITLQIAPMMEEPEPRVPVELEQALAAAQPKARTVWSDITALARRDWIQWIETAKREETRLKRIASACDMLAKGKRRPCCFDRSGMYAKNISCPVAADVAQSVKRERGT